MSFIATHPESFAGQSVGSGHCVALVQTAAGAPHTSKWRRGARVREHADTPAGTAIATFSVVGRYENRTDGFSHAAILIGVQAEGLLVWDQWRSHPTAKRTIRYKSSSGPPNNDGDKYYIIETEDDA